MQKQQAQPASVKSPQLSFSEDSYPHLQSLTLNEHSVSMAETNDDNIQKKPACLFEADFFKTKGIDKKSGRYERQDVKKKHNYQRKVQVLQKRIEELQKQVNSLRRKQQICPQCCYNLSQNQKSIREIILPQDYYTPQDVAGTCQKRNSKESIQFEKINFMSPLMMSPQMQEKSWIFLGTMFIAMGSKIMDVDGTLNVFKVLKESVDSIRRQVEKCQQKISMDFFLTKEELCGGGQAQYQHESMNFDPFFAKHEQHPAGFQLQGVKLESVEQYELFYDQKINFNVKYQALLAVIQYLRQNSSIC